MAGRPNKGEILGFKARTGASVPEIVEHFHPSADERTRAREYERIRKIVQREAIGPAPQRAPNVPSGDDEPGPARIVVEERHHEPGQMERVAFIERQLARLEATMEAALEQGNIGRVAQLDSRISEVRQHLDSARGEAGRAVSFERDVGSVVEAVDKRHRALQILRAAKDRQSTPAAPAKRKDL